MVLTERFRKALSSIEFQLVRSLPVINAGKEVLFFYKVEKEKNKEFKILEIRYVVFRNYTNGQIEIFDGADVIPEDILNSIIGGIDSHKLGVKEKIKAEDSYLELYEKLFEKIQSNTEITKKDTKDIWRQYIMLTNRTILSPIYAYLGKDFLQLIEFN